MMIYIPFIYFISIFLYYLRKRKCLDTGGIIMAIYIVGSLFSIIAYYTDLDIKREFDRELQIIPTFLYLILLTLSILPFYRMNSSSLRITDNINHTVFLIIGYALIVLNLVSFITSYDAILLSLSEDFGDTRSAYYLEASYGTKTRLSQSLFTYIISSASEFFPVLLLFFFISSIKKIGGFWFRLLLILSSMTRVILSIIIAGRTQVIYWIMLFGILFITFWRQLENTVKIKFAIILSILLIPTSIYFILVTEARFGEGEDAENSLVVYAGQTYPNFCKLYHHYSFKELTFDRVFPITTKYVFGHDFETTEYREKEESRIGMKTGIFFTYLGDAMLDFGVIGMIIYTVFYVLLARKSLVKNKRIVDVSYLIIMLLLIRQVSNGYFAYVYKSINTSLFVIGSLFIAYLLRTPTKKIKS